MPSQVRTRKVAPPIVSKNEAKPLVRDTDAQVHLEFGGPIGALCIMLFSHCLMIYICVSLTFHNGSILLPSSLYPADVTAFFNNFLAEAYQAACPTWRGAGIYFCMLALQSFFAVVMPGVWMKGLPIPSEGGKQLPYKCNGYASWVGTLSLVAVLYYTGIWSITELADNYGGIMSTAMIFADCFALALYFIAHKKGCTLRTTGNFIYDLFMGVWLNPRIGWFDFKMWAEIRVSWSILFLLSLSAAVKQHETYGFVSTPMLFLLTAHFLYANACQKGEECIPSTWDIFYEKFGWMLVFWNLAGVPFVYCFQPFYLLKNPPFYHGTAYQVALFVALFGAYYVWDTAQAQCNRFRMQL
eukprot:Colp12_sorted_trinity150504_noHs@3635